MSAFIIIPPDWSKTYKVMCDCSVVALGVVKGQRMDKINYSICFVSKARNEAQKKYTVIEQELLAVVYAFKNCANISLARKL